ncbi:hypothetical protein O181_084064 [Austropuccinia psidii MF-1]|uniref:Uncharacterized protein n=1 Tax=Austropuccinia psidii MF-1 TaxID=1389203 RepID=A0A9Q3FSE5_9BASI|nr:hypothetical protein [Austropuccinia psidii MF-1]
MHYCKIIQELGAHSEDGSVEGKNFRVIRKLPYCSLKANILFRRLDASMEDYDKSLGKKSHQSTRVLPKIPNETTCPPPKGLPINFYSVKWLKVLPNIQNKRMIDL